MITIQDSFNKETEYVRRIFSSFWITITRHTENFPSIKNHKGQKKIGCFPHVKIGKEFMIFPSIKKDMKITQKMREKRQKMTTYVFLFKT